jgi:hypothetical protein
MRLFSNRFCIPFPKKIIFITSELITTKDDGTNLLTLTKRRNFSVGFFTAIDFRARLRFPRVARESPRHLRSCGVPHGQLQGLEAQVISQTDQEGKERLLGRFVLCPRL